MNGPGRSVEQLKTCPKCQRSLPREAFSRARKAADGLQGYCLDCNRGQKRTWYASVAGRRKCWAHRLLQDYGITLADWDAMLVIQNGRCDICERPFTLRGKHCAAIDHCHHTGEVRALIHRTCNTGIGMFEDNAEFCRRAAWYLDRHADRIAVRLEGTPDA